MSRMVLERKLEQVEQSIEKKSATIRDLQAALASERVRISKEVLKSSTIE